MASAMILVLIASAALSWFALPRVDSFLSNLSINYLLANTFPLLAMFILILCLTTRPIVSAMSTIFAATLIVLGSNFKYSVVSQPVLISDFLLARQVAENTELFGKYFIEQWYLGLVVLLVLAAPILAFFLERPLTRWMPARIGLALLAVIAIGFMPQWAFKRGSVTQSLYESTNLPFYDRDPIATAKASGLFASLIRSSSDLYFEVPKGEIGSSEDRGRLILLAREALTRSSSKNEFSPDLIVVVNEAFFDLRLIDPKLPADIYAPWDRLKEHSIHGSIQVDTYGGATLRTEFSALTGIPLDVFPGGVDYPYFSIVSYPFRSLPHYLRSLDYRTVAIHPYNPRFWNRDVVYPYLGFDSFLSSSAFADAEHDGPYVSDAAVCDTVFKTLDESSGPTYVFVVTMENHGPWGFERGSPSARSLEHIGEPTTALALNRYLYHLENAMRMAECLIDGLGNRERSAAMVFFGDHAPALPEVYKELGLANPWTSRELKVPPFIAWRSWSDVSEERILHVSYLPSLLLEISGVDMNDFFTANAYMRERCRVGVKDCDVDDKLKAAYTQLVYDQFEIARE
ncbi:MAG: LTA synthase family protein [Acidiferrobacterales bacterium]